MDSTNELLAECQRYFPGLAWFKGRDNTLIYSEFYGYSFRVIQFENPAFAVSITSPDGQLMHKADPHGTPAEALALAAERWREFAAEAMAVVGPLPEPKLSPEHQRQSDLATIAYLMEGDRQKAQGLPPDREAQARAGAEAMAWAEDNPE